MGRSGGETAVKVCCRRRTASGYSFVSASVTISVERRVPPPRVYSVSQTREIEGSIHSTRGLKGAEARPPIGGDCDPIAARVPLHAGNVGQPQNSFPPLIDRHRTAMTRTFLSRPLQQAHADGLLDGDVDLFDYGCGRGDDVRTLTGLGIEALRLGPHPRTRHRAPRGPPSSTSDT